MCDRCRKDQRPNDEVRRYVFVKNVGEEEKELWTGDVRHTTYYQYCGESPVRLCTRCLWHARKDDFTLGLVGAGLVALLCYAGAAGGVPQRVSWVVPAAVFFAGLILFALGVVIGICRSISWDYAAKRVMIRSCLGATDAFPEDTWVRMKRH